MTPQQALARNRALTYSAQRLQTKMPAPSLISRLRAWTPTALIALLIGVVIASGF